MKSLFLAAAAAAVLVSPAVAETVFYDAAENEFIVLPTGNPANAEAAAAAKERYTETLRFWDASESEFVTVRVGPGLPASAIATNDSPVVLAPPAWDPAD